MPEGVIAPLLAWSLKYVTLFAPDILATRNELIRLEERQTALAVEDAAFPPGRTPRSPDASGSGLS